MQHLGQKKSGYRQLGTGHSRFRRAYKSASSSASSASARQYAYSDSNLKIAGSRWKRIGG